MLEAEHNSGFPAFSNWQFCRMLPADMPTRPNEIKQFAVTYEPVPHPDPKAMEKAIAVLFRLGPYSPLRRFDFPRVHANVHHEPDS